MSNPWLAIKPEDYVGHMASPEVDQLPVLTGLLRRELEEFRPRDLLILGCTIGHGLEHVDPAVTNTVTGVDINPEYLQTLKRRFPNPGWDLTLRCEDVVACELPVEAYDWCYCRWALQNDDESACAPKRRGNSRQHRGPRKGVGAAVVSGGEAFAVNAIFSGRLRLSRRAFWLATSLATWRALLPPRCPPG